MAEVVERNIEDSLNEVAYIKKLKLFTKSEINEIIRKRRQHEYSLQKRNKRVLDYDAYISTELTVLKLLRFRRQKLEDRRYTDKLERSIIQRIVRLHRQLCYRFQSRIDVWMRFIKFCKIIGRHMSVVRLWNRVLQVHGRTDPRLWAAAAFYHLHEHPKVVTRSTLRNAANEVEQLSEQQKSLKQEYEILIRYVDKRKQKSIRDTLEEMRLNTIQLNRATSELNRESRLAWDRVYLNAIREARRLLTEGLSLNSESATLHLELVKLEANAADYFSSHILPRMESVHSKEEEFASMDMAETLQKEFTESMTTLSGRKKTKRVTKMVAEDNTIFMSGVTEDVEFVASGGAFNIVFESVLNKFYSNISVLESLDQIISELTFSMDNVMRNNLKERLENLKSSKMDVAENPAEVVVSPKEQLQSTLNNQILELHRTVMTVGIAAAISMWDSWYTKPCSSTSSMVDTFRLVDPKIPEAVSLLHTRLLLHTIDLSWSDAQHGIETVMVDRTETEQLVQSKRKELIKSTRTWMDTLATSQWGYLSPDFWMEYINFESKVGDCTRTPALKWKASKCLKAEMYGQFTKLLNSYTD